MPERSEKPLFINRELSWLEFNGRVMEEAMDSSSPLLERLKFLAIFCSNLDEFFMVRVGALQQMRDARRNDPDPAGLTTEFQLTEISRRVHEMVDRQYTSFLGDLEVALAKAGLRRLALEGMFPNLREYLQRVFEHDIYPVLTPVAMDPESEFPRVQGLGINLIVRLKPTDPESRKNRYVLVAIPRRLGRFITVPVENGHNYVLVEDVAREFVEKLLPGEPIVETIAFRLTRNADMSVREDQASDLMVEMKEILHARKQSACVRLEVAADVSKTTLSFLRSALDVDEENIYLAPGPLDLSSYMSMSKLAGFDDLRDKPWPPQPSPCVQSNESLFEAIARNDVLLFHPYDSFDPVIRLIEEAAEDPDVLAIKQILYRTSEKSPVVAALARAASRDKHVTVIVELKARFDEARNIAWAEALEQTGVQVIYGLKGLKTHAKICIIVRREPSGIRRYLHFGTGNYNEITARTYSDVSYMTCREDYGSDATAFFNMITGYSQPVPFRRLEAAPIGLRARLLELIESEIQRHEQGQKGHIMAKINSLVDTDIIRALYRASKAGVKIQLNVRGICCLRPGVEGLSDNIQVVSIVDRFLEHSRILYFHHGNQPLVFISSADWMPRNLDRRIELLIPIDDDVSRTRLIGILQYCFRDTAKSRVLQSDGRYLRETQGEKGRPFRTQEAFYRDAREAALRAQKVSHVIFEPQRPAASA